MPLIVVGVCRYTFNGTYLGQPVANICDMYFNPLGVGIERTEMVESVAEVLLDAWAGNIMPVMKGQYIFNNVSWVDLDSPNGSVGSISSTAATTLPLPGTIGGEPYSGAIAIAVTKNTNAQRGAKSGRMFLPPCGEADINGNTIGPEYLDALQDGLDELADEIRRDTAPVCVPVVTHVVGDSEVGTFTTVISYTAKAKVTTQRRRLGKGA